MTDEDKVKYLANIYHLLIADGGVDRLEERVLDEIRRDLRAGYFETQNAKALAQQPGYQVELAGRLSERVANFEDMLFAAYCNGVVERTEKTVLQQYLKQLGINQAQLDMIKQEAKHRYEEFKARAT